MVENMNKYIGKEVVIKSLRVRGRLSKIGGAEIRVTTEAGQCRAFLTGTGPHDNAVANGYVVFADPTLKEPFLKDYEEYRHSFMGQMDRLDDAFFRYD